MVALAGAIALAGGGTAVAEPGGDRVDRRVVQRLLEEMTRTGAQGAQVRVVEGRHEFTARAGTARIDSPRPVPTDGRFRIASITKTFVATVVLQLVGEGEVELDAPVSRYLPGLLAHGDRITVRHLLQHRSGLADHMALLPPDAGSRPFAPEELVALIATEPLEFEPGTTSGYNNTNFVIAGMVVERVTGRSYAHEITQRVLLPLGLRATSLPGTRARITGPHARAYYRFDGEVLDITEIDPSFIGAAGEMISTTADLTRFTDALLDGRLLRPAQQRDLLTTFDGRGLGIVTYDLSCGAPVWGHNGNLNGYVSTTVSTADTRTRLTLSVTWAPDEGPISGRQELLEEVFC
ncbi:serine hydrolase domain-containing protein [Saccharothrix xinjiangensis]